MHALAMDCYIGPTSYYINLGLAAPAHLRLSLIEYHSPCNHLNMHRHDASQSAAAKQRRIFLYASQGVFTCLNTIRTSS